MIVASVNPQPQQARPANDMFGEMVPHPQGSGLLNETSMLKVHPLTPQPPGPVDISVVPYEDYVQHPYIQSSAQPPPHHPSNQLHDAVVISSPQHPNQPHGTVMPTYLQQQPIGQPGQVQSEDGLLIGHYQQSAHPHHDLGPAAHQPYPTPPPGAVVFASNQNAYHQPHEMLPTQQQFVGQPQAAPFPGLLMTPTHQHTPHDGVVHAPSHQSSYPMHDPLPSPTGHHASLLHTPIMFNPHMPSPLPGMPPPIPAAVPHQYPGPLHGSVVPAFHNQYPGSIQGTVVAGPPHPHPHSNGMGPPAPPHATPLNGAVVPPPLHPTPLAGGILAPLHQNPGSLHNTMLSSVAHQHPGSLQGTIVPHQHTSPIHSAAVMPTHHHQQQHPATIFGNLASHQQHQNSSHSSVLPCPRQQPHSGRLHGSVGPTSSRQQHSLNRAFSPSSQHYSSVSKSNDNDSNGFCQLPSSSSSSSLSSSSSTTSSPLKAQDNTECSSTITETTATSTAGSQQNSKVIDSAITPTSLVTSTQSKFFSTSTSVSSDSASQTSSQHVPIKKLGTLASKPNGFTEPKTNHKIGQSSYKDSSKTSEPNSGHGPNKTTSTNGSHGPWELRTPYSNSLKSAAVMPSLSTAPIESAVTSSERSAPSCSQRSLPSQSSLLPPRMSLSVNGMLPPTNGMVGKLLGYQHLNGSIGSLSANGRAVSPLSSKKDSASTTSSSASNSDIDAITTNLEKSRLHDNQFSRQLDNTNGNNRRRYVSESWRRQNSESAAASYSFPKQQQPLWSSGPKDQIKVVNLPVDQMKRPMYPLKMSKNSYSSAEGSNPQPRDTLHLTFFLH